MEQPYNAPPQPQRSGLLTTLCILTWVWGGIAVILGIVGLFNPMAPVTKSAVDLLANIGSILAAVMMWKLNKTGLLVYAICELIPIITGIVFGGASMAAMRFVNLGGMDPMMLIYISLAIVAIIDLVFVFLYHLGLKQSTASVNS